MDGTSYGILLKTSIGRTVATSEGRIVGISNRRIFGRIVEIDGVLDGKMLGTFDGRIDST